MGCSQIVTNFCCIFSFLVILILIVYSYTSKDIIVSLITKELC